MKNIDIRYKESLEDLKNAGQELIEEIEKFIAHELEEADGTFDQENTNMFQEVSDSLLEISSFVETTTDNFVKVDKVITETDEELS